MRCRISGRLVELEIPLLVMLFYLFRDVASSHLRGCLVLVLSLRMSYAGDNVRWGVWLGKSNIHVSLLYWVITVTHH